MTAQRTIPGADAIESALAEAHARYKDVKDGANASYIPALAQVRRISSALPS
jgi:glutaminase